MTGSKTSSLVKLIVWLVVLAIFVSVFVLVMTNRKGSFSRLPSFCGNFYSDPDSYSIGEATYSESISVIELHWICGKIELIPEERDDISVTETAADGSAVQNEDDKMRTRVIGDTLTVQFRKSSFTVSSPKKNLTVRIPEKVATSLSKIEIDSSSAEIRISDVSASTLKIDTASGNLQMENSVFLSVQIDASSADLTMNAVRVVSLGLDTVSGKVLMTSSSVGTLDLDTVSGFCQIESDTMLTAVDVDSVSGDITLKMPISSDGFRIDMDGVSGKAEVNRLSGAVNSGKSISIELGKYLYEIDAVSASFRVYEIQAPEGGYEK